MKTVVKHFILTLILVALPSAAMAQRVPATDSGAIGGDGGLFMGRLSARPTLEGFYEYYFSPGNSLRIGLGWARPEVDQQYLRVPVDLVYNWERGSVHPFGGAVLGIYFLHDKFWDGEITGVEGRAPRSTARVSAANEPPERSERPSASE